MNKHQHTCLCGVTFDCAGTRLAKPLNANWNNPGAYDVSHPTAEVAEPCLLSRNIYAGYHECPDCYRKGRIWSLSVLGRGWDWWNREARR